MNEHQTKKCQLADVEIDQDDRTVGRILSRREILTLLGVGGATVLAGGTLQALAAENLYLPMVLNAGQTATLASTLPGSTATPTATGTATPTVTATATTMPACVVRPEKTVGPYFVDEMLNRSDIRSDPSTGAVKAGVQFDLKFVVSKIASNSCAAFAGAQVDIWHCDAGGLYSDESANGTSGQKFLRGYQVTDANGVAQFTTIYPGWYSGRTVHIHFKIRATTSAGGSYEFISQLFFDDTLTDQIFSQAPYNTRGTRNTRNATDNVYGTDGGQLLLTLSQNGTGYSATFDVGLNIS